MSVKLLRLSEVSEVLGLSLHTVRRWASERRIPIVKIGRAVLVDERELGKLIEARSIRARSDIAV